MRDMLFIITANISGKKQGALRARTIFCSFLDRNNSKIILKCILTDRVVKCKIVYSEPQLKWVLTPEVWKLTCGRKLYLKFYFSRLIYVQNGLSKVESSYLIQLNPVDTDTKWTCDRVIRVSVLSLIKFPAIWADFKVKCPTGWGWNVKTSTVYLVLTRELLKKYSAHKVRHKD